MGIKVGVGTMRWALRLKRARTLRGSADRGAMSHALNFTIIIISYEFIFESVWQNAFMSKSKSFLNDRK